MWRAVERLRRLPLTPAQADGWLRGEAPFLASAKLKLVDGCNLRCFMCDYWKRDRPDELGTGEVLRLLDDLRGLGCEKVHFTGGELFLRRDALELLGRAAALGMRVNLTTNGTLLDRDRVRALLALEPRSVTVSVDSPAAAVHDAVRGQAGAHARTTRTIDRLLARSKRTKVRINTVVSARNLDSLVDMPAWLAARAAASRGGRGVHQWLLIPVDPKPGGDAGALGLDLVRHWNRRVAPALEAGVTIPGFDPWIFGRTGDELRLAARGEYARGHYRERRCHAPWLHTLVDARGDVYPCCMGHRSLLPLGNVRERPITAIFHGEDYARFRRAMLRARTVVCHRCDDFLPENKALDQLLAASGAADLGERPAPGAPPAREGRRSAEVAAPDAPAPAAAAP